MMAAGLHGPPVLGERVGQGPVRGGGFIPECAQGGGRQRAGPRHLPGQAAGRSDALQFLFLFASGKKPNMATMD